MSTSHDLLPEEPIYDSVVRDLRGEPEDGPDDDARPAPADDGS